MRSTVEQGVRAPLAAVGLCVVMVGAAIAHAKLNERGTVLVNSAIFAACAFVAVGTV